MGRTLKRVPIDFDWPLHRVWKGYINPYKGIYCPYCYSVPDQNSNGETIEARRYQDRFYGFKLDGGYIDNPYNPKTRFCTSAFPYKWERWEYDFIVSN